MPSNHAPKLGNSLKFHRQKLHFPYLTDESKRCLRNLVEYRRPTTKIPIPRSRSAAVLVALFIGRKGDLYVLLSRRSSTLRTYAGDTSLPGGKTDPEDKSPEDTARREAFEEIGLPRDRRKVPLLCVLEPFVAGTGVIVTPVVALILDNTLQPILNHAEVASLFSHPLASFLTTSAPFPTEPESLEVPYHSYTDWPIPTPDGRVQMMRSHRFLTGREAGGIKPVFGITASIMIRVANIGYGRLPDYEWHPPGSPNWERYLAWTMLRRPELLEACEKEGLRVDVVKLSKLAGVRTRSEDRKQIIVNKL